MTSLVFAWRLNVAGQFGTPMPCADLEYTRPEETYWEDFACYEPGCRRSPADR